jgi:phage terminase large subunit-like protein
VGLVLDPWQRLVLDYGLGESPADRRRWAAFEVAMVLPRQNGKGSVLMAREIAGLFMFHERLILHSAHEVKTAREAFERIATIIEECPALRRKTSRIYQANGKEGIQLTDGCRLLFLARSTGSGRGFSGDVIVLDEAQILDDGPMRAMLPTLSARPNPQVWYAGTTGNERSPHLSGVRRRAKTGTDPWLAYLEWGLDELAYFDANAAGRECMAADQANWAAANPALGIRIFPNYVEMERAAMSPEGFAAERLGIGEWPTEGGGGVIPIEWWEACGSNDGIRPDGDLWLAVDVTPDTRGATIAVAGLRGDGRVGVEIIDQRPGSDWVPERVAELWGDWPIATIVVDKGGPAGTLLDPLTALNLTVTVPSSQEVAQAAEGFFDAIRDGVICHQRDSRLNWAVAGAKKRPIGEAWGWGRRASTVDISPLVAASLATWAHRRAAGDGLAPADITVIF